MRFHKNWQSDECDRGGMRVLRELAEGVGTLGSFTPETWIKEAARVQLTPSRSFGAAPALRGQTAKPPRLVSTGPPAAAGAAGGARSPGGPVFPSDGASSGHISLAGAAARPAAPGSSARGAGDAHGGSGPAGICGPVPAGAPGPWPPLEPGSPVRPEKPGGSEERAGRSPCPGDGSDPPRTGDAEYPGIPRAAQRPLHRAKGFRPAGLGPAGRICTRSPHASPTRPRVPARSSPRARPRASCRCGNRERRTGRRGARGTPELGRGAQGSDMRAPGPLSSRGPEREAPGLGIADGPGRKESPGAPGSAAVLLLKWFLISAGRTALCSPATLLLIRCAFVLNGRCRPGHQGVTRS
ncbi:hypothetical protein R6Z07M_005570 [Ovis aries]